MGNRLESFASLKWYDAFIEFLFKLAAKTSEPLLAIGIVYSAAEVLSHGHLGYGNQAVQNAWAITQALAIESSGGVVLVYGLQSLREKDHIKAWCYLPLSFLLALVGGVMLFMQMASLETIGGVTLWLFGLRCFVSIAYIYLCRAKYLRFSGLHHHQETSAISEDTMSIILTKLEKLDALELVFTQQQQQQAALPPTPEHPMLPEPEKPNRGDTEDNTAKQVSSDLPVLTLPDKPNQGETSEQSYEQRITALYRQNKEITIPEIVEKLGCSTSTAQKWLKRLKPSQE